MFTISKKILIGFASATTALTACATEGGVSAYSNGAEWFASGALPPPGTYGMLTVSNYSAEKLKDNKGKDVPLGKFKIEANAAASRFIHVFDERVLGGNVVVHTILPIVKLKANVAGVRQSKTGLGDVVVGGGIGFHHSDSLHSVVAVDFILPTGDYDKTALANVGKNHLAMDLVYAVSIINPSGFNLDVKAGYLINGKNSDTDYRSGDELHADYAVGWGFRNGWTVGAAGFLYQQLTNDRQNGVTVTGNKGRAYALGPSVKYQSPTGWFVTGKFEREFSVRNRSAGKTFAIKAVLPF